MPRVEVARGSPGAAGCEGEGVRIPHVVAPDEAAHGTVMVVTVRSICSPAQRGEDRG